MLIFLSRSRAARGLTAGEQAGRIARAFAEKQGQLLLGPDVRLVPLGWSPAKWAFFYQLTTDAASPCAAPLPPPDIPAAGFEDDPAAARHDTAGRARPASGVFYSLTGSSIGGV